MDLGDFNGDARIDLVATNDWVGAGSTGGDGRRHLVLNTYGASGVNFTSGWVSAAGDDSGPWPTLVADLDGDGDHDLVTARIASAKDRACRVRLNDGTGKKFTSQMTLFSCEPLAALDMDKDGDTDLVIAILSNANGQRQTVQVLNNHGTGSFTSGPKLSLGQVKDPLVAVGNLDGDGLPEIVIGSRGAAGPLEVHGRAAGTLAFTKRWASKGTSIYNSIHLRDLDGDGLEDMMVSRSNSKKVSYMVFVRNLGKVGFSEDWLAISTKGDPFGPVLVVGDLHSAPSTAIRITGKDVIVQGFKELRGFSTGVEVTASGATVQWSGITDPDLYGVLIKGTSGTAIRNVKVGRLHMGVGLGVLNSTGVQVEKSTFCPVGGDHRLTALSSYCAGGAKLSGKGNRLMLNNGCQGIGFESCR